MKEDEDWKRMKNGTLKRLGRGLLIKSLLITKFMI
jgi:hypothetical protein